MLIKLEILFENEEIQHEIKHTEEGTVVKKLCQGES